MKDLFGKALIDYHNGNYTEDLITSTSISEEDVLPLPYLFRDYNTMPKLEQTALNLAHGKILDVGCGAGSHSLYLQEKGLIVKAIDISDGSIKVCKARGITNAKVLSIFNETETFDTILLLMNGTGIFEDLAKTPKYLTHLKQLLKPDGQILIDSSDIKYMYEDEDGGFWIDGHSNYYGELDYYLNYKNEEEAPFKMLYLDYDTLKDSCETVGLKCDLVVEGEHYDYLAKLSIA